MKHHLPAIVFFSAIVLPVFSGEGVKSPAKLPPRQFVDAPRCPPVLPGVTDPKLVPAAVEALVGKLGHEQFRIREDAQASLTELVSLEGESALQVMKKHSADPDPEVRHRVTKILAEVKPVSVDKLLALTGKGLNVEALEQIEQGGVVAGSRMVDLHLQGRLGFDILYSLPPDAVLPQAFKLLEIQEDVYYKALLVRLIDGVLSRAILPVLGARRSRVSQQGIEYLRRHKEQALAIQKLLHSPCAELRLTALRVCAHGLIALDEGSVSALLKDSDPDVASEARRFACLLKTWKSEDVASSDIMRWMETCVRALNQDDDELAQMGSYVALSDLLDRRTGELYAAYAKSGGRAHDALGFLLTGDVDGRMLFLKMEEKIGPTSPPQSLERLLALREYDILDKGLPELMKMKCAGVAPLLRRNLVNLSMTGNRISRKTVEHFPNQITDTDRCAAAVHFHMNDLIELLKLGSGSSMDKNAGTAMALTLNQIKPDEKGEVIAPEFQEWYTACAANLEDNNVDVATGAVRGIITSGRAGALALARHWLSLRADAKGDPEYVRYVRSLCLFHPYTKFILEEVSDVELKTGWETRGLKLESMYKNKEGTTEGDYAGGIDELPFAIWGFIHNNNCNYIHPVGTRIAAQLRPYDTPLLISWLDHNSRMAVFLAAMDARESAPAILRRLNQRRTNWTGNCYDHDLFHGVVVFEIFEAAPFLEHYTKTNSSWPHQGLEAMAGIEMSRFCWTQHHVEGRANPLTAPAVNELLALSQTRPEINRSDRDSTYAQEALVQMGWALNGGRLHGVWRSWADQGRGPGKPHFFVNGTEVSGAEYSEARKKDASLPPYKADL